MSQYLRFRLFTTPKEKYPRIYSNIAIATFPAARSVGEKLYQPQLTVQLNRTVQRFPISPNFNRLDNLESRGNLG